MIEEYEDINKKLKNAVNECVKFYRDNPEEFKKMLSNQIRGNSLLIEANRKNRLIQKENRLSEIESQYSARDYLEGEIGTIDEADQLDGIINLALLALCSNRITKFPKIKEARDKDQRSISKFYRIKAEAISSLLSSILVLSETSEEYKDFFSYGNRIDDTGKETFVIDLPYFGQICLHYGNNKELIVNTAKEKAKSILERKCELQQISREDMEKIEISDETILPQYTGRLYEYSAGFPLENEKRLDDFQEEIGIKDVLPEEINKEHIRKIYFYQGLNDREKNYLVIKLGFSKKQIEELLTWMDPLSEVNKIRVGLTSPKIEPSTLDARKIGKNLAEEIPADERNAVGNTVERGKRNDKNIYKG